MGTIELKYFIYMILSFAVAFYSAQNSLSADRNLDPKAEVEIQSIIANKLGGEVRVEVESAKIDSTLKKPIKKIQLVNELNSGNAIFSAESMQNVAVTVFVKYQAWKSAWIPRQRILPGSTLQPGDLELKEVNITAGINRDSWALFLDKNIDFAQYESKNTLLEGMPVLRTQVRKSPDIRKGELVRMSVSAGSLSLTTSAIAQEPGVIGQSIRILTQPTKKEMSGVLLPGNRVEVKL